MSKTTSNHQQWHDWRYAFICRCHISSLGEVALHCIANKVLANWLRLLPDWQPLGQFQVLCWPNTWPISALSKPWRNPLGTQPSQANPDSERPSETCSRNVHSHWTPSGLGSTLCWNWFHLSLPHCITASLKANNVSRALDERWMIGELK